jgi:hypothetical protein
VNGNEDDGTTGTAVAVVSSSKPPSTSPPVHDVVVVIGQDSESTMTTMAETHQYHRHHHLDTITKEGIDIDNDDQYVSKSNNVKDDDYRIPSRAGSSTKCRAGNSHRNSSGGRSTKTEDTIIVNLDDVDTPIPPPPATEPEPELEPDPTTTITTSSTAEINKNDMTNSNVVAEIVPVAPVIPGLAVTLSNSCNKSNRNMIAVLDGDVYDRESCGIMCHKVDDDGSATTTAMQKQPPPILRTPIVDETPSCTVTSMSIVDEVRYGNRSPSTLDQDQYKIRSTVDSTILDRSNKSLIMTVLSKPLVVVAVGILLFKTTHGKRCFETNEELKRASILPRLETSEEAPNKNPLRTEDW